MHLSKEVLYLLSASVFDHHIVALELGVELQRDFALSNTVATCVSMQRAQLHTLATGPRCACKWPTRHCVCVRALCVCVCACVPKAD